MSTKKKQGLKIYARVRQIMPWETPKASLKIMNPTQLRNTSGKTSNEYNFSHIFGMDQTNEDVFNRVVVPMIGQVLQGFNSVLIAYGQTGSGKTYTMLGKQKLNLKGLLPLALEYFLKQECVKEVTLSAVEAFGHHVSRIELYDLFADVNQAKSWPDKRGSGSLEPKNALKIPITDENEVFKTILKAHGASHFAPTGKNPDSSRGHCGFVITVTQSNGTDAETGVESSLTSSFLLIDLAGSEGESAFTPEFVAKIPATTLMARRLEAGCINTGLSQLQVLFNELRVRGRLSKMVGTGLRRICHAYVGTNCMISVLFMLSPSKVNCKPTESTLKFAVHAGMVKVQPVKAKKKVNMAQLVKQLRSHIEEQKQVIEGQQTTITDLEGTIEVLKVKIKQPKWKKGVEVEVLDEGSNTWKKGVIGAMKKGDIRVDFGDDDDGSVNGDSTDARSDAGSSTDGGSRDGSPSAKSIGDQPAAEDLAGARAAQRDRSVSEPPKPKKKGGKKRKGKKGLAPPGGRGKVRRSLWIQNNSKTNVRVSPAKLSLVTEDLLNKPRSTLVMTEIPELVAQNLTAFDEEEEEEAAMTLTSPLAAAAVDEQELEEEMKLQLTSCSAHDEAVIQQLTSVGSHVVQEQMAALGEDALLQMPLSKMTKDQMIDRIEILESLLREERIINNNMTESQQVVIDHLMDTNEGLLRFFQMRKVLPPSVK